MSKVILCADDSVTMQTVADITFRTTEYTYVGARTTDDAIDKIKAQRPVLVLADAVMPGKTGYDLCHALKSDPATSDIPVVIMCGNSAPYDGARGGAAGADGSLTKPWDTQVMLDKVAEILDKVASSGVAKATGKPGPATAGPATTAPPGPSQAAPIAAAPAPAQPKIAPPRSATIMGMPTIKMPGPAGSMGPGIGPGLPFATMPTAPAPVAVVPPTPVAQTPVAQTPVAPSPVAPPVAPPPVAPPPVAVAAPRPVQAAAVAPAATPRPAASVAQFSSVRAPMVSGIPSKRSAVVERTLAKMGERLAEMSGLAPGSDELTALVKLSSEVVERIVWEIVPELAETIIREHVAELAARRSN